MFYSIPFHFPYSENIFLILPVTKTVTKRTWKKLYIEADNPNLKFKKPDQQESIYSFGGFISERKGNNELNKWISFASENKKICG